MQKVFVIILNYNGNKDTQECLESLEKINVSKDTKVEIVVVDNASKEQFRIQNSPLRKGFEGQAEFRINKIKVIRNEENLGFAEGNNVGIRYALKNGANYILILNNDTFVDKNLLKELLAVGQKDKEIGILVPKIYFAPGFEFHKDRYKKEDLGKVFWYGGGEMDWANVIGHHRGVDEVDKGQYDATCETEIATGCCMLIKKDVFDKVGMFDDKFYLYYEDADLCLRAKKKDFKVVYVPRSIIWHKNAGSAGGSGSKLQDYYITRNRLLFGVRYAGLRAKIALFKESLKVLLKGRYWQKLGIIDFYRNRLGRGSFRP